MFSLHATGLRVKISCHRVSGSDIMPNGVGCEFQVQGAVPRYSGVGFSVQGSRLQVQGSGFITSRFSLAVQGSGCGAENLGLVGEPCPAGNRCPIDHRRRCSS